MRCPPSTHSTLARRHGRGHQIRHVLERRRRVLAGNEQCRPIDGTELLRADVEATAAELRHDRRSVGSEQLLHRHRQPFPACIAQDNAEHRLGHGAHVDSRRGDGLLRELCIPPHERLAQGESPALQQRQRADAVRVAQGEIKGDLPAVAAPDHDRRSRRESVDQGRRIVGVLVHVRGVRLRALAAGKPASVVDDRAPV